MLSDPARRARYDRTGSTEESIVDDAGFNWTEYYRSQFAEVITTDRIDQLRREYQGSADEKRDVLDAYERSKGDLDRVFEHVMLSEVLEDEDRLRALITAAIESGEAKAWPKFTNESQKTRDRRRKKAEKERREAEREAARLAKEVSGSDEGSENDEDEDEDEGDQSEDTEDEHEDDDAEEEEEEEEKARPKRKASRQQPKPQSKSSSNTNTKNSKSNGKTQNNPKPKANAKGGSSMNDLVALIQQRQASRAATSNSFFDKLEAKYAPTENGKGKGKKRTLDEPSEEAFAEMAKRGRKG